MLDILPDKNDDSTFLIQLSKVIAGISKSYKPEEIYLTKIDNWFGEKWFGFAGKSMGVLGLWSDIEKSKLIVPPFNPSRVVSEERFSHDKKTGEFLSKPIEIKIHKKQQSWKNLKRFIDQISSSAIFVWYSGNTFKNSMASLLVYVISANGLEDGWYVSFEKNGIEWKIKDTLGITSRLLEKMIK